MFLSKHDNISSIKYTYNKKYIAYIHYYNSRKKMVEDNNIKLA